MRADEIAAAREAALQARRHLADSGMDIDDAHQEALINIWRHRHSAPAAAGEHRRNSLRRLGRLGVIDALRSGGGRSTRRPVIHVAGETLAGAADQTDTWTPERHAQLGQALDALSGRHAAIVALLFETETDVEIAAALGVSPRRIGQQRQELHAHFERYL